MSTALKEFHPFTVDHLQNGELTVTLYHLMSTYNKKAKRLTIYTGYDAKGDEIKREITDYAAQCGLSLREFVLNAARYFMKNRPLPK